MKINLYKKSLSNFIIIVIMIFLVIILIIILWNLITRLIGRDLEKTELQSELINSKIEMEGKPEGDWVNYINLSLKRGPGKVILVNTSTTYYEINPNVFADIVSAVDLSNTIGTVEINKCFANPFSSCCELNNCSTSLGCSTCNNGIFNITSGTCYFQYFNPSCCYNKNCKTNSTNCQACLGNFTLTTTTTNTTNCKINNSNVGTSCTSSGTFCNNTCEGSYKYQTRLDLIKEANKIFIKSVFNQSTNHRIGFIAYSTLVNPTYSHNLSNDTNSLTNKIITWKSLSQTNICDGINSSIELLKKSSQNKIKVIVIMTDGAANSLCNGTYGNVNNNFQNAKNEAIAIAGIATNYNIKIYTIGFGSSVDSATLNAIALAGNGTYSYSDISNLNEVYYQIANIIKSQAMSSFRAAQRYDHIKVIFLNETSSYFYIIRDIPNLLETRVYYIPSGDILSNYISNVTRIEIYLAGYTDSGQEVLSPLLDSYDVR